MLVLLYPKKKKNKKTSHLSLLKLNSLQPQYQNGEVQEGRQCGPPAGWWQWRWDICGRHSRGYLRGARRSSRRGPNFEGMRSQPCLWVLLGKSRVSWRVLHKGWRSGPAGENRPAAGLLLQSVRSLSFQWTLFAQSWNPELILMSVGIYSVQNPHKDFY